MKWNRYFHGLSIYHIFYLEKNNNTTNSTSSYNNVFGKNPVYQCICYDLIFTGTSTKKILKGKTLNRKETTKLRRNPWDLDGIFSIFPWWTGICTDSLQFHILFEWYHKRSYSLQLATDTAELYCWIISKITANIHWRI